MPFLLFHNFRYLRNHSGDQQCTWVYFLYKKYVIRETDEYFVINKEKLKKERKYLFSNKQRKKIRSVVKLSIL